MKDRFRITKSLLTLLLMLLLFLGCSSGASDDSGGSVIDPDDIVVAEIYVDAAQSTININESTAVTATVYDESGSPIAGAVVGFQIDQPSLAAVSPASATTDGSGIAHATLTARDRQGDFVLSASSGDVSSNDQAMGILSGVSPAIINLTATPSTLLVEGTATIEAQVLDADGNAIPNGTSVSFEVTNANFGSMSPSTSATINGYASASFIALNQPGTATIQVSSGSAVSSIDLLINQSQPASLEFYSATPTRINVKDAGGTTTSEVIFRVIDENGNPLSGINVVVNIEKGPNGGEYINTGDTGDTIEVSSDDDGLARVILRSGTLPGPVTLKGTITYESIPYVANSSVVSIGGGVPSAGRFSVAATVLNIPGLNENNLTTDITAYMADRYGNYNILEGTTVSFWSEAALAVDASTVTLDEDGMATVIARTQHPVLAGDNTGGQDVAELTWETNLLGYVLTNYGWTGTTHPRDGWASVMVFTQGEEKFDDLNANGLYDAGEFDALEDDTHDDPFIDYNDNDTYNYTGTDPEEIFNDSNNSGAWDSKNGVWDSQKDIFHNFHILITGRPYINIDQPGFTITSSGGSASLKLLICDRNLNYLSEGTTISMSIDVPGWDDLPAELLVGGNTVTLDDSSYLPTSGSSYSSHLSSIEYPAVIQDLGFLDHGSYTIVLTVTVGWEGTTYSQAFTGTTNIP